MVFKSPLADVPVCQQPLQSKILDAVAAHSKRDPEAIALVSADDPSDFLTYGQFHQQVDSLATFLNKKGFGHKDVVCQVLSNSFEFIIGMTAAIKCGGVMSGASALFTKFELERQFQDSRSAVVITDSNHLELVEDAAKNCPLVKTILVVNYTNHTLSDNVIDWRQAIKTKAEPVKPFPFSPEDLVFLPYSSGTTGSPKGVMLCHRNSGTMFDSVMKHMDEYFTPKLKANDDSYDWFGSAIPLMLPYYHIYGLGLCCMSLLRGQKGIVFKKFVPDTFLGAIERYRIKMIYVVPPIVLYMAKSQETRKYDLSSLRITVVGAAPTGKDLAAEFNNKFPHAMLTQAYGMTETALACSFCTLDDKDKSITTVGHMLPSFIGKIVDGNGKEVAMGERGELLVKSPTIMLGYFNNPKATKETIEDGWLHTGDVAVLHPTGEISIVDRMKELIKVKGLQVPPAELEDLLLSHREIVDAAVIGIKDEKAGEKPLAFVVKANKSLTERDVQKFVEEKLSTYKWLTGGVRFVESIPKSPSGKILRRLLRDSLKALSSKL